LILLILKRSFQICVYFLPKIIWVLKSRTARWVGLVASMGERSIHALWVIEVILRRIFKKYDKKRLVGFFSLRTGLGCVL
jgi:hypothetical protein